MGSFPGSAESVIAGNHWPAHNEGMAERNSSLPAADTPAPGEIGIELDTVVVAAGEASPWGLLSAHRWFLVVRGEGTIEGPDGSTRFAAGDVLLAPAGLRHRLCATGEPMEATLMRLRWRAFAAAQCVDRRAADLLSAVVTVARESNYRLPLPRRLRESVGDQLKRMAEIAARSSPAAPLALKARLLDLLATLTRWDRVQNAFGQADPGPGEVAGMRQLLRHLEEHYADPLGVREAAALVGLGRSRFHETFRAATGTSFSGYLTRLRVSKAAQLLRKTSRGVLDIAFSCGFGSTSRFYEAFGQIMGTSPARYRRGKE
jgi:AraC-like DNA-binding protein